MTTDQVTPVDPAAAASPITISAVEAIPLEISLAAPFRFANVVRTKSENVVVRLTSDAGVRGFGEACPVPQLTSERASAIVDLIEREVAPLLLNADASARLPLLRRVATQLPEAPFTLAAIDCALLDLVGRSVGLSVYTLLGGRFRDELEIHGSIGWNDDLHSLLETARLQADVFRVLKLYAGPGDLEEDVRKIEAVREAVGDAHPFIVDVNGLWTPRQACSVGERLRRAGVVVLEQPIAPDDREGQQLVARSYEADFGIDVAADERIRTAGDVAAAAQMREASVANLGMSKLGGPTAAAAAVCVAQAHQLQIMVGSVVELGIATAAGAHLAATIPALAYPSYLMGPLKYERQLTYPALAVVDGKITVPTGPGLGIEVDEETLSALDRRR